MDGIKYTVFTEKSLRLLGKNQYTFNVESGDMIHKNWTTMLQKNCIDYWERINILLMSNRVT
jgi:hypothetical protein